VVHAAGPNGESLHYGVWVPVLDPTHPQTRQLIQMETGGGRRPLPGMYVAYPYGRDIVETFKAVSKQLHEKNNKPMPSFQLLDQKDLGQQGQVHVTRIDAEIDEHDGRGTMRADSLVFVTPPFTPGTYAITIYEIIAPKNLMEQERPTFEAMANTYKRNAAVIGSETQQEITRINQIGETARKQAEDSRAASDRQHAAYWAAQRGSGASSTAGAADTQAKLNQDFHNYLLDQTEIQDNETNERGAVWNQYADSLVKNNPDRYQYVPTKDFLKGVDY